ncbi:MAG TPA: serine/threonine-protein kinase [Kofleriaceae bacterium]
MGGGPEQMGEEPPQRFGDYSILGHLATGGMAEVFIARKTGLHGFEKIVVIKRVRPDLTGDTTAISNFLDEARLVATLEHPNIVPVYEVGYAKGSYFFVMEYIDGVDLRQLIGKVARATKRISLADAIYIVIQICTALHYAHEKRDHDNKPLHIIHRDVTPSNVLISHNGAVKVCDFGIAKAQGRSAETARGTLKGKFAYMSPEQCKCEVLDHRSDIFAIGVMLYELTTGTRLFKTDSDFETLKAIVETPIPPPSSRVADYPQELEVIVMRALEKQARRRYPTAQGLQLELEAFAREYKLALSSVNIAKLISSLFDKSDVVARARRDADENSDTSVRKSGPVPIAHGSADDVDPDKITESEPIAVRRRRTSSAPDEGAKRRPSPLWLVAALVAGAAAGGITMFAPKHAADDPDRQRALDNAAEKVASAVEMSARSGHTRAESIATSPMLRAAIQTDAATIKDLAEAEGVFRAGKRETVEVFQTRDGVTTSVLRLPPDARALPPLATDATHIVVRDGALWLVAGAPIGGRQGDAGVVEIELPVDLAYAQRALTGHFRWAALSGPGGEVPLIAGQATGDRSKVAVPMPAELSATPLSLIAIHTPRAGDGPRWVAPVRYASFGLGGLFVLIYLMGFVVPLRRT